MAQMKHSPTPWEISVGLLWQITDANGAEVALIDTRPDTDADEDLDGPNAQRILACVNACEELEHPEKLRVVLDYLRNQALRHPEHQSGKAAAAILEQLGVSS